MNSILNKVLASQVRVKQNKEVRTGEARVLPHSISKRPSDHLNKNKVASHSGWWQKLTPEQQAIYTKKHPKSRKHLDSHNREHLTQPRDTEPKDGPVHEKQYKIVWPQDSQLSEKEYNKKLKEHEKAQKEAEARKAQLKNKKAKADPTLAYLARIQPPIPGKNDKGKEAAAMKAAYSAYKRKYEDTHNGLSYEEIKSEAEHYYHSNPQHAREDNVHFTPQEKAEFRAKNHPSKVIKFLSRIGKAEPDENLAPEEQQEAIKQYKEFLDTYQNMDADDLSDAAEDYYRMHPEHAEKDGVEFNDGEENEEGSDNTLEDSLEQEKIDAENNPVADNPTLIEKAEGAYKKNPFDKLSKKLQEKLINKAVNGIAGNFSANTNKIIANTYQFLNHDQVQELEKMAQEAMTESMSKNKKEFYDKNKKTFLKIIAVTAMVAAGVAFGGPLIGVAAFNHAMTIAHPDGNLHKVVWNSLKGKLANGKDDPDFDPHEDAVEKIIKSLKKQLYNIDTNDVEKKEKIKDIIDKLKNSVNDNNVLKDKTARKRRPIAKPKPKPKSINSKRKQRV